MENSIQLQARLSTSSTSVSSEVPENWEALVGEIMIALMPFPDARQAVVTVLLQADQDRRCPTCGREYVSS